MSIKAKQVSLSVLVSLLFIPVALLAEHVTHFLSSMIYFIYNHVMFLNVPDWLNTIGPPAVSGLMTGAICGFVVVKIYRNTITIPAAIVPILFAILLCVGLYIGAERDNEPLLSLPFAGDLLSIIGLIVGYIAVLNNRSDFIQRKPSTPIPE